MGASLRWILGVVTLVLAIAGCSMGAPSVADERFVTMMLPHHRLGLAMIEQSMGRVADVEVRRLIFEMSGYHTRESHELEHLAHQWGADEAVDFPGRISDERLEQVVVRDGLAFDIGWLEVMIEHHQGAITIARDALADGVDPDVRRLAEQVLAVQVPEVAAMESVLARLCGDETSSCR